MRRVQRLRRDDRKDLFPEVRFQPAPFIRSQRGVDAAMAQHLAERIKKETGRSARVEGLPVADWVLIDAGDVIVHLFRPEVRTFYNLERMWAFGDTPPVGNA